MGHYAQATGSDNSGRQTERLISLQADLNSAASFQGAKTDQLAAHAKAQADAMDKLRAAAETQARTANANLAHLEELDRQQMRARVHIATAQLSDFAPGLRPKITIVAVNTGHTTACITGWVGVMLREHPQTDGPVRAEPNPDQTRHMGELGEGETRSWEVRTPAPLDPTEFANAKTGRWAFYIYGELVYSDGYGRIVHLPVRSVAGPYEDGGVVNETFEMTDPAPIKTVSCQH